MIRLQPFCGAAFERRAATWCAAKGVQTVATETDHIKPVVEGGTNDIANLQRLCTTCHEAKTLAETKCRLAY